MHTPLVHGFNASACSALGESSPFVSSACNQGENSTCKSLSTCDNDGRCSCVTGAFSVSGSNNDCRNGSS